jgi:hypothetical protein
MVGDVGVRAADGHVVNIMGNVLCIVMARVIRRGGLDIINRIAHRDFKVI